jgi:hypothetical protein
VTPPARRRQAVAAATVAASRVGKVAADAEPHEQLLFAIGFQRSKVDKLEGVQSTLAERAGVEPGRSGLSRSDAVWTAALPATRQVFELQQEAIKTLGVMSVQYVRLGHESRELQLREQFASMFLTAITRVFDRLDLTDEQRRQAPRVVEETVRLLEAA